MTAGLLHAAVADLRDIQPPVIAAILLRAGAAKLSRMLRTGPREPGLSPTALFPLRLRGPLAAALCAAELALGIALVVTLLPVGTRAGVALFAPRAATGARIAAAALFVVPGRP